MNGHHLGIESLLFATSKRQVERICKRSEFSASEFVGFLLHNGQSNEWIHEKIVRNEIPYGLEMSDHDFELLRCVDESHSLAEIQKAKLKEETYLKNSTFVIAHLFRDTAWSRWHIVGLDQRDTRTDGNTWQVGSHVHFLNFLFGNLCGPEIWERLSAGNSVDTRGFHIRLGK